MRIINSEFLISVADPEKCPDYGVPEIAVVGKSNVGKSSLINFICNHKIAKTSGTPGKTRLINYFGINNRSFVLVDLPGYGFAKVPDEEKKKWDRLVGGYLKDNPRLKNVLLLLDVRHDPTALDLQMMAYLHHYGVAFSVVATKADKLSKMQIAQRIKALSSALALGAGNIYVSSSLKKEGGEAILERIEQFL